MRDFRFEKYISELLTPNIVNLLTSIHEYKGKQELFLKAQPDLLNALIEIAKIQGTGASNRIEGIYASDSRLQELVQKKSEARNSWEREIAGYRKALNMLHESYVNIPLSTNLILQLHQDLYTYSDSSVVGSFKNTEDSNEKIHLQDQQSASFQPVSASETPAAIEKLCIEYETALEQGVIDPLLLIPMFVLDFLCTQPFKDGNGCMSRLLSLLLLYQEGYIVCKYISLEGVIEKTKEIYYGALEESSTCWHEEKNRYAPFVTYLLSVILSAYKEFSGRVENMYGKSSTKAARIHNLFTNKIGKLSKAEISTLCPDISVTTIEKVLSDLLKDGYILKLGTGRSTKYIRNQGQR